MNWWKKLFGAKAAPQGKPTGPEPRPEPAAEFSCFVKGILKSFENGSWGDNKR